MPTPKAERETAKHTPGPWHVSGRMVGWSDGGSRRAVCELFASAEVGANARLIAAAPDLLAACVKVRTWVEAGMPAETKNILGDLDAAIAKAGATT